MNIGEKIRKARKGKKMSMKALAEAIGVSSTAIQQWESGAYSPNADNLAMILKVLDLDANYLLNEEYQSFVSETPLEKSIRIKLKHLDEWEQKMANDYLTALVSLHYEREDKTNELLNVIQRPEPIAPQIYNTISFPYFPDRPSAGTGSMMFDNESPLTIKVKETPITRKADFVLQVTGRSMEPKFHDADFILVKKQDVVENGEVGIFLYDGQVFIKQLKDDLLHSFNPAYDDIRIDGEIICFGKVLGKAEV